MRTVQDDTNILCVTMATKSRDGAAASWRWTERNGDPCRTEHNHNVCASRRRTEHI
jgi:hypothetical protein